MLEHSGATETCSRARGDGHECHGKGTAHRGELSAVLILDTHHFSPQGAELGHGIPCAPWAGGRGPHVLLEQVAGDPMSQGTW